MIKILFIHNKLVCGGAEQALFDLVCLLDKTKFDATVLEQCEGGIWTEKFRSAGIRVVSPWSCQKTSKNPFVKLTNYVKRKRIKSAMEQDGKGLIDACLDTEFDIIVSYHVISQPYVGFSGKAKTIMYIHSDMASNALFYENIIGKVDIMRRFDRIICVSEAARKSFETFTHIAGNVHVCLNPLNSDHIRQLAQESVQIESDLPIVVAVGRLAPEKGYDRLIRIHKKVYDDGIKHKLVIVGDGAERAHLTDIIYEVKAQDSAVLVGYTENPYPYMSRCRFVVCSSFTEGLPVIAMEALALGTPVVSAIPSIGELFGGEVCGIVTENDDISLECGFRRMLTDSDFYQKAKSGAQRRSAFFDGKSMASRVEKEFFDLMENHG